MTELLDVLHNDYALDYKIYDLVRDIDPETHALKFTDNCKYYNDDEFGDDVELNEKFSLIHFNCRSLYANFTKLYDYLRLFKGRFKLIALSETWLNEEKGAEFPMEGYKLYFLNRRNKRGGGVALYVDNDLKCKQVEPMSIATDDLMECITVEIEMEKQRNIVISCVYRAPGSNMDTFKETLEEIMDRLNERKTYIVCGDFNIDLLNTAKHNNTSDFLDALYSRGLYPLITKPSRITSTSATLIDNIFINDMQKTVKSGLLVSDISDHLPVFAIYGCEMKRKDEERDKRYTRARTTERVNRFRDDLLKEQWIGVYVDDVNVAYASFLNRYLSLYDKHCPILLCKEKSKYCKKQWITKGLQNACKKKNKLYRDFIKFRTKKAELQYKAYKNKLTIILRQAKKDYYNKKLLENKNDIKSTWKIINKIIQNNTLNNTKSTPTYFINDNDMTITNPKDIADEFNSYFVNTGPNLAKSIKTHDDGQDESNVKGGGNILQSMFIGEVNENEIRSIIAKLKNKTSTDSDGIDMYIVKETVNCIIKPLEYIFNLSFRSGIFPSRMKIACK